MPKHSHRGLMTGGSMPANVVLPSRPRPPLPSSLSLPCIALDSSCVSYSQLSAPPLRQHPARSPSFQLISLIPSSSQSLHDPPALSQASKIRLCDYLRSTPHPFQTSHQCYRHSKRESTRSTPTQPTPSFAVFRSTLPKRSYGTFLLLFFVTILVTPL